MSMATAMTSTVTTTMTAQIVSAINALVRAREVSRRNMNINLVLARGSKLPMGLFRVRE